MTSVPPVPPRSPILNHPQVVGSRCAACALFSHRKSRPRCFPPIAPAILFLLLNIAPTICAQQDQPAPEQREQQPEQPIGQPVMPPTEDPADHPPAQSTADLIEDELFPPGPSRLANLESRLAALTPENPRAYFLLAEEIAAEALEPEGVALARQLLLSAYHLESQAAAPRHDLLASICLLAAELERVDATASWLRALASALDPRHAQIDWNVSAAPAITDEAALGAVRAISLTLAGEGIAAAELLQQPDVRALLRRYEPLLSVTGLPGGLARLERYARLWPCSECRNQRWTTRVGDEGSQTILCPTCRGNPGPQISEEEYLALLRFQARLLDGIQQSWAAEIITSGGAPLLDPDPAEFLRVARERYGLDPASVVYEDGEWRRVE